MRREVVHIDMERQIALPTDARNENVNATFRKGELLIEVPRTLKQQPKRIEVKSQDQRQDGHKRQEGQKQMAGSSSSR